MKQQPTPWDFVEKYYPNYHTCDLIALSDDLVKIIDEEFEVGDSSHKLLIEQYGGDKLSSEIFTDYYDTMMKIYEKAIENFQTIEKNNSK